MAWRPASESPKVSSNGLVRWIFRLVPLICLVIGLGLLVEAAIFMQTAQSTHGRVIDIQVNHSDDGVSYTPRIRYRRGDGRTFEAETHISSTGYNYKIGEEVEILYARDTPDEVRIDSFLSIYGPGLILSVIGAGFLLIVRLFWRRPKAAAASARLDRSGATQEERSQETEPRTTDPWKYGHVHEPKPKRAPTIRRMR